MKVEPHIQANKNLGGDEKLLHYFLSGEPDGHFSKNDLAKMISCSPRRVVQMLQNFEDEGFLEILNLTPEGIFSVKLIV